MRQTPPQNPRVLRKRYLLSHRVVAEGAGGRAAEGAATHLAEVVAVLVGVAVAGPLYVATGDNLAPQAVVFDSDSDGELHDALLDAEEGAVEFRLSDVEESLSQADEANQTTTTPRCSTAANVWSPG
eukprot:scaffold152129_cov12-Prasinocladus_malaysianus.AAC.1